MSDRRNNTLRSLLRRISPLRNLKRRIRVRIRLATEFEAEKRLLAGELEPTSRDQSIVFHTAHKCASVFAGRILKRLTSATGLIPIDFDTYFFLLGERDSRLYRAGNLSASVYGDKGFFFGPYRNLNRGIPDLTRFRNILMLRDPRDVLVSLYYSMGFSHNVPGSRKKESSRPILDERARIKELTVDEYVLDSTSWVTERYPEYLEVVGRLPSALVLRYEDMVTGFETWLQTLADYVGIDPEAEVVRQIRRETDFEVGSEDRYAHKRQVMPGDHVRKLQPETIARLNEELADLLTAFGYEV